jgi:2-polyprenyl-6-methoxyphenol hydroxylase-like FAD-dependent oxidoreductase
MINFKVIIIGAGLAGALLANGLIRENVDFVVYEREEKDGRREGYQVRLGAPALKGLRKCLSKDQLDALLPKFGRSGGVVSSAPVLYSPEFKVRLDMTKFPAYAKSAPIDRVVLANALADPLHDAGKIVYGKRFKRYDFMYDDQGRTKVKVFFEDGTSDIGDLLVSAEGSGSLVSASHRCCVLMGLTGTSRSTHRLVSTTSFSGQRSGVS